MSEHWNLTGAMFFVNTCAVWIDIIDIIFCVKTDPMSVWQREVEVVGGVCGWGGVLVAYLANKRLALVPPKPNEFDMTAWSSFSCGCFGT